MLTDLKLMAFKPTGKIYKITDQQGLYAAVTRTGVISFRDDYRIGTRRETLVIGKYDSGLGARSARSPEQFDYGMSISLAEARALRMRAARSVERGDSPSRGKAEMRLKAAAELIFGAWANKYFEEAKLAESTKAMRRSVYDRHLEKAFSRLKLEEITPNRLMVRCERIKEKGAAAPAVHARDIVLQVFRFVRARGMRIENPAEAIKPSAIATFKPRDRALSPAEIQIFSMRWKRRGRPRHCVWPSNSCC